MENPNKVSDWKGFWLEMLEALKRKIRSIGSLDPVVSELKDAVETSILASAEALEEAQDTKEAVEVLGSKMEELSQFLHGLDTTNISPEGLQGFQMALSEIERIKQNTNDTYHLFARNISEPLRKMMTDFPSLSESDIEVKMLSNSDDIHICIKSEKLEELAKAGKIPDDAVTAIYANLTDDSRIAHIQTGYGDNVNVIVKELEMKCDEKTISDNPVFEAVKKDLDKPTFEAETAKSKTIGVNKYMDEQAKDILADTEKNNPEAIPELIDKAVENAQDTIVKEAMDKTIEQGHDINEIGRRVNNIICKVVEHGNFQVKRLDTWKDHFENILKQNGYAIDEVYMDKNGELRIKQGNKDYIVPKNEEPEVLNTLNNQPDTPNKSNKGNDER